MTDNENQNIEWKLAWKDEYLKVVCAFANTFFRAGYIESWGRGTVKIVEQCKAAGLPEPVYEDKWGGLAVVFKKSLDTNAETSAKTSAETSAKQKEILEILKQEPTISYRKVAKKLGVGNSTVQEHFEKLKEKGLIRRIGPAKGGHWEIME